MKRLPAPEGSWQVKAQHRSIFPSTTTPVVLICSLAFTLLFAGSWHAGAQSAGIPQSTAAPSGSMTRLAGHTARQVLDGTAIRVSHYKPEQKLRLALLIQPPHMAEEEQFLTELATKGSPNFHQFLSAEEWNARFGPSAEDEQKVVDWAESQGFTVTNRYANRLIVDVEAPVGVIEKALGVTINNYQVGDEVDFANDQDPMVPAGVSTVLRSVLGLNSIQRMRGSMPVARKMKGADYSAGPVYSVGRTAHGDGDPSKAPWNRGARDASERTVASNPDGANSATVSPFWLFSSEAYDYSALYNLSKCCNVHNDSDGSPADTSIALVTFGDFSDSDVQTFFADYGFAYYYYTFVVNGATGQPGVECNRGDTGCPSVGQDDEAPGDLSYATATANSFGSYLDTARVYVYEGANGDYNTYADLWNFILTDNHAHVVSTSYGASENYYDGLNWDVSGTAAGDLHPIMNALAGQGFTLVASAGDNGSAQDCSDGVRVIWPAADPNFVAAGGTGLTLDSSGNFVSEVAWTGDTWSGACGNNWGGGGGGQSIYFAQPTWQNGVVSGSTNRLLPDISLSADPDDTWASYYYNGGWSRFDGTSLVAPMLAGFFTQVNSYLNSIGHICGSGTSACEPIGNPNWVIYGEGTGPSAPHYPFYDITSGCNSNDITAKYGLKTFCAGTGYDQATGWGSANMLQLAWTFNWDEIPADGKVSVAFTGPTTGKWYKTNQTVSWTVSDVTDNGTYPPPGVAGFTQGWDSIPSDPHSEPHGGSGNSFYSGPQFPYATAGCLAFEPNSCSGGVGQGCHYAKVQAWDNQGNSSGNVSYGPLCYDTVAPTAGGSITPTTYPASGWFTTSATLTLTASDPGGSNASGVAHLYYSDNNTACSTSSTASCYIYSSAVTFSSEGKNSINFFSEDNAGNFSSVSNLAINIDETAPSTKAGLNGVLVGQVWQSAVTVVLTATDNLSGVAATYYTVDGGSPVSYTAPFPVSSNGAHTLTFHSVDVAGNVETTQTVLFTIGIPAPPALSAPAPGSKLTGSSAAFTWSAGVDNTMYQLRIGNTGVGSSNLYASGAITALTANVTGLPTNGGELFVRLYYEQNSAWKSIDYTYVESGTAVPPAMTSPTPGGILSGSSATFNWSTGAGITAYQLRIGNTGVGSDNLYASGVLAGTSANVTGLPTAGAPLNVRLYYEVAAVWHAIDYLYSESGTFAAPALTSPAPGSKLTGSSAAFSWTTGSEVTMYQLRIGNTGVGSSNLYASGAIPGTTANVTGLPTNGGELFVRLYYESNNVWTPIDYTYVESGTATPPALTSPTPGSVLTGSSADFGWTSGAGITAYQLRIGTTGVGSQNLYASGVTALLEENVTGLPTTGATLYVRLYYEVAAVWHSIDYLYSEFGTPAPPALTSPTPGSTLTGSSAVFSWTAGSENTEYQLRIGNTGVGSENLYASGAILGTTATATGLPTNGGELFVRLYYQSNNVWTPIDYTYVESGTAVAPVLNSPTPGSTLAGSTVEFGWTAGAGITAYQLRIGTTGVGSQNLYASGVISLLEENVAGLPTTGGTVYVRLYYEVAGVWKSADYTYTAQ